MSVARRVGIVSALRGDIDAGSGPIIARAIIARRVVSTGGSRTDHSGGSNRGSACRNAGAVVTATIARTDNDGAAAAAVNASSTLRGRVG